MSLWRFVGVLVWALACVGVDVRSSDPVVVVEGAVSQAQLDPNMPQLPLGNPETMETDIPGPPLTPDDFLQGKDMVHKDWDPTTKSDPIEIAGLFQGDINLMSEDEYFDLVLPSEAPKARNAMMNLEKRWPNGVIPYVISSSYDSKARATIATAMNNYHETTCIRFVPRTVQRDYIHIIRGDGCSSSVGRVGGAQAVSLGFGCIYVGIVMHEFMHASGFWHEQSRADRDEYITINTYNIQNGMEYNFQKYNWGRIQNLGVQYDLGSIMHYGAYAFAKDRSKPTIIPRITGVEIGQRRAFSRNDTLKLRLMYNCEDTSVVPVVTEPTITDKCKNYNNHCKTWAKMGECSKNPTWMHVNCRKACGKCNTECSDNNDFCDYWAKKGECLTNPGYMSAFCKKSCGVCHANDVSTKCLDENQHCKAWSEGGQCRYNPNYMLQRCRKSCGQC